MAAGHTPVDIDAMAARDVELLAVYALTHQGVF